MVTAISCIANLGGGASVQFYILLRSVPEQDAYQDAHHKLSFLQDEIIFLKESPS